MAKWRYEGLNIEGKRESGTIDASSRQEVRRILRAKKVKAKKITPPSILEFDITEWMVDNGLVKPFTNQDLSYFTKQLSIMIDAGVPIIESLDILWKQQKNLVLKKTIKKVKNSIGEGQTIAAALQREKGFDKFYCNLVKAGEAGGVLDSILEKLSTHLERQEKLKSKVKSALTYPTVVTVIGILVIWAMMVYVVPQFMSMLESSGQEPPFITTMVLQTSSFLQEHTLDYFPFIVAGIIFFNSWRKTDAGRKVIDPILLKIPLFGNLLIKGSLANFTRTLSIMLSSGVSLVDALDICTDTVGNSVMEKDLRLVKKRVVEGKTLTEPLSRISYFPDMVTQMIRVGEQTGQVDQMLEKVADVFEDEVNVIVENITKLIEPLILVVLGGAVALILVAMYLPMFMSAGGV